MNLQQKKRIFYSLVILTGMMVILLFRLVYIQIFMKTMLLPNSKYTLQEMSVLQRERAVVLDSGRGTFTDRHGESLTDETIPAAILFPVDRSSVKSGLVETKLEQIAESLGTSALSFHQAWQNLREPSAWRSNVGDGPMSLSVSQANLITQMDVSGIKVLPYRKRYSDNLSGMQWLGYLSQSAEKSALTNMGGNLKHGGAGLEKTLEPLLRGIGPTIAYYTVDGRNNPLSGAGIRVKAPNNPYYPLRFTTTIDKRLQQQIENLTNQSGMKQGAVVVLDAHNADIMAMVSVPFYNPLAIHPGIGEWNNKAIQATTPGSIFKTVIAAAALEAGVTSPNEKFHCNGHYKKYGLSCWKEGGHGTLTLEQAYAESCNVVFATLAERLESAQIEGTAQALGMGRRIGWEDNDILGYSVLKPLDHEETGTIFDSSSLHDGGVRAQTGIGQRDVTMTPLQAANLVVTLLNRGQLQAPRILERISYHNGQVMKKLTTHTYPETRSSISPETARLLSSWMRKVVTEGTGKSLAHAEWPLAGKSGTAQVILKGNPKNNQWFIGYGPVNQPEYAVAVLFQNVAPDTNNKATALFGQIMGLLSSATDSLSASGR
ncbi:peptidoglycan D,D-transpeptidase FtsI family protein [Paenibacillus sp. FA6]|uniref:peptidoglycan D,D-transpeptidase FtsI family protein n=1 Tax=Paenibacillus sp. FA6 TaxID=3413029 RepID=UPI003F659E0F